MDNRIANDMISSGMIPSGEKNKEDLSRTQYGSVPSPNKLMDAYKSMYEHHKKDADGNTIPHEDEIEEEVEQLDEISKKTLGSYITKATREKAVDDKVEKEVLGRTVKKKKDRSKGIKKAESKLDAKVEKEVLGRTVKKPKGFYDEEIDRFDIVFNHFISEGYSEKEAYAKMANLTEEQLDEFLQALAPLAKGMMAGAVKVGAKAKPLATFAAKRGKALGKVDTIAKAKPMTTGGFEEPLKKVTQGSLDLKGKGGMSPDTPSSVATGRMSSQRPSSKKTGELVGDEIKRQATATVVNKAMSGGGGGQKNRTGGRSNTQYQQQSLNLSHDLFDIVKGKLLDEGLSEEEIKDIMLTLTPDEIMKEMNQGPSTPVSIDKVEFPKPGKKVMPKTGATYIGKVRPKPGFKMNPASGEVEKNENV